MVNTVFLTVKLKLHDQFSMISFLDRVDGEPVSLPTFSLSSIYGRVNQQQVSLTIFYFEAERSVLE